MKAHNQILLILLIAGIFTSCQNSVQNPADIPEEDIPAEFREREPVMEAERVAFLTRHLELTPDEAKLFWPVFDVYSGKKNELWKTQQQLFFKTRPRIAVSSELAIETIDSLLLVQELILKNDREFTQRMLDILPPEKVLRLHHADQRFKRHLLKKIRGRQHERD